MTTTTTTRHLLNVLPEIVPLELRVRVQTRGVTALPLLDDLGFGGGLGLCGVMVSSTSAVVWATIYNTTPDIMIEDGSVKKIVGPKGTRVHISRMKVGDAESLDGKETRKPPAHGMLRAVRWRWLNQVRTRTHRRK